MFRFFQVASLLSFGILLSSCQSSDIAKLTERAGSFVSTIKDGQASTPQMVSEKIKSLPELLRPRANSAEMGESFPVALKSAAQIDPALILLQDKLESQRVGIEISRASKDFDVSATVYGGVEDITDETAGVALVLNANRLIADGGRLDSSILAQSQALEAASFHYAAELNSKIYQLGSLWIDLEKYQSLMNLVQERLKILDPLIGQLEEVANAGVGDVTQVAAAQRTVSAIRVAEAAVYESLTQAELSFVSAYGDLPNYLKYDSNFVSKIVPLEVSDRIKSNAPNVRAAYASYLAAESGLAAISAEDSFNVGFEARVTRPFGGSGYDSDESVGLVARKTLLNNKKLESKKRQARADISSKMNEFSAIYREGEKKLELSLQASKALRIAIELAQVNAVNTAEEVVYLRRQLIIGASTLESVLSAEARKYDAESKEINFNADLIKTELAIVSALGLLAPAVGLKVSVGLD
jgi:outer membrane protein TolC